MLQFFIELLLDVLQLGYRQLRNFDFGEIRM